MTMTAEQPTTTPADEPKGIEQCSRDWPTFSIEPKTMATALRAVVFATDTESRRYALGAVKVDIGQDFVRVTATDGRRLARWTTGKGEPSSVDLQSFLIPKVDAKDLIDRLSADTATGLQVRVGLSDVYMSWTSGNRKRQYDFRQQDGIFPRCDEIIDSLSKCIGGVVFKSAEIDTSPGVWFSDKGEIKQPEIRLDEPQPWGEYVKVLFNPEFIADWLLTIPCGEDVKISWTNAESAIHAECGQYRYVFMPLSQG